jgi:imidazolonepropionase-like amidohydrolase
MIENVIKIGRGCRLQAIPRVKIYFLCSCLILLLTQGFLSAQVYSIRADRVFDGSEMHEGWKVVVEKDHITAAGPADQVTSPSDAVMVDLKGMTLLPGLIEGHSHIFLHPYNETSWDDQVLHESRALRIARATVHAKNTLMAGFTVMRDLGTEGAGYADVGLRDAIEKGIIPGPRMLVAGRAIVATGSYGPKGFDPDFDIPLGAQEADGSDLIRVVREQIGKGVDYIKVYTDATWGPTGKTKPTFSEEELALIVKTAKSAGVPVAAHAHTAEGIRRAVLAGVETIEHGLRGGTPGVFQLMAGHDVALFPTLEAYEAILMYGGWHKDKDPMPELLQAQHTGFREALRAGVPICCGSDVGVFSHGDNALEPILMVEYGMAPLEVLRAATSRNAHYLHLDDRLGTIKPEMLADVIAVKGNPAEDIKTLRDVVFVMKNGVICKQP